MAYVGEVRIIAGNIVPDGWLSCEGQLLSTEDYQQLFSILATIYGGDGAKTFGLPDLRGRVVVGCGTGNGLSTYNLGNIGGQETTTLSDKELPIHSHTAKALVNVNGQDNSATSTTPQDNYFAAPDTVNIYAGGQNTSMANDAVSVTNELAGEGKEFSNLVPYLSLSYIICYKGEYPSPD